MRWGRRRWGKIVAALAVLGAVLVLIAYVFSPELLCVERATDHADFIVLLGGGGPDRTDQAVRLFKSGAAPKIIVTGTGDCEINQRILIKAGVPESDIETECRSRSTKENAEFTVAMLRTRHADKVILVTSWYHSRRALACFDSFGKGIQFWSEPTSSENKTQKTIFPGRNDERRYVLQEYVKLGWYLVRYGIGPW